MSQNKTIIPWKTLLCQNKPQKSFFCKKEREIHYKIAINAFKFEQMNRNSKMKNFVKKPLIPLNIS